MKKLIVLALLLVAIPAFGAEVTVQWNAAPAGTFAGYQVYISNDGGATWLAPVDVGNVTQRVFTGIADDREVKFKISGYRGTGASRIEVVRHWSGAWHDERLKPPPAPGGAGIQ